MQLSALNSDAMKNNSTLELYHSTWAMERRHPDYAEWDLQEQCDMVASNGFNGFNIDPGTEFIPAVGQLKTALDNAGLTCSICAFPGSIDEVKKALDYCDQVNATALVLNARVFPFSPNDAAEFVNASIELGKTSNTQLQFETHRFTITNDLLFTIQLLDLCPELELVADLSHYVVGREMPMPIDDFYNGLVEKVLSRSVSIQARIANREQIQLPIHFQRHQPWLNQFYEWWDFGMRSFIERHPDGAVFNFTCELGPPDYAITDEHGYELSDRWQESLILKNKAEEIWKRAIQ